MKFSITFLTLLTGLAIAAPNPVADPIAEAEVVDARAIEAPVEARALDGNCVRCISKGCGKSATKCLKGRLPPLILGCLALNCGDDFFRCCA
jgi:hypothetical protein